MLLSVVSDSDITPWHRNLGIKQELDKVFDMDTERSGIFFNVQKNDNISCS